MAAGGLRLPPCRGTDTQSARAHRARLLVVQHRRPRGRAVTGSGPGRRGLALRLRADPHPGARAGDRLRRPYVPAAQRLPRRLLLRGARRHPPLDRLSRRGRSRTRPDLHRPAARPQALPLGERARRATVAAVAHRTRHRRLRGDPGRTRPYPAGAHPARTGRRVQLAGVVRTADRRPGRRARRRLGRGPRRDRAAPCRSSAARRRRRRVRGLAPARGHRARRVPRHRLRLGRPRSPARQVPAPGHTVRRVHPR